MKNILIAFIATTFLLLSFSVWSASTKEEIQALSAQVEMMQKDLAEIKKLLKEGARAPAKPAAAPFKEQTISIGTSPVKGKPDATVTLVEYSDYQCPFCARHYRQVMPTLEKEYIETGKLKFVMRENPIPSLHRNAVNASKAAVCAGGQGKYWEMHNLMFDNQKELGIDNLKAFADTIGLDTDMFKICIESEEVKKRVNADIASGVKLGAAGTPGFFLGLTDPNDPDKAKMSVFIKGARSLDTFKASIDDLLESAE